MMNHKLGVYFFCCMNKLNKKLNILYVFCSKEAQLTAQVKKECDSRAMKIVEFLIEGKLRPEIFMRCVSFSKNEIFSSKLIK